jgi:DNA primase
MEYITLEPSSEVIIAADADKAGREAARRAAAQSFRAQGADRNPGAVQGLE